MGTNGGQYDIIMHVYRMIMAHLLMLVWPFIGKSLCLARATVFVQISLHLVLLLYSCNVSFVAATRETAAVRCRLCACKSLDQELVTARICSNITRQITYLQLLDCNDSPLTLILLL